MGSLADCIKRLKTPADDRAELANLTRRYARDGMDQAAAEKRAVAELMDEALSGVEELRAQLAEKGHDVEAGVKEVPGEAPAPDTLMQSAFHGSPYRFDKFSLEHIGSGEGAQAYGYGLYFAGEKNVAEWYKATLEKKSIDGISLEQFYDTRPPMGSVYDALRWVKDRNPQATIEDAAKFYDEMKPYRDERSAVDALVTYGTEAAAKRNRPDIAYRIDELKAEGRLKVNDRQLYEVNIPDDEHLMLWDKPLSEQPEAVKKALMEIDRQTVGPNLEQRKQTRGNILANGGDTTIIDRQIELLQEEYDHPELSSATGEKYYTLLSRKLGSDRAASEYLRSLGIPGHKYLDGTSRSKGEGSYNYVIYDDAQIAINKTFYQRQDDNRAAITFDTPSGRPIIDLFAKANASSFLHESGHVYFNALQKLAVQPDAPETVKQLWLSTKLAMADLADSAAARGTAAARAGGIEITVTADDVKAVLADDMNMASDAARWAYVGVHEEWARQLEGYFLEGKAPAMELRGVFQKFKDWLKTIYRSFENLGVQPSKDLQVVFARMFATERQIAEAEAFHLAKTPFLTEADKLTDEQRKDYAKRIAKAKETAEDRRMRRLAKAYIEAMGGKEAFTKAAQEEINAMPIYAEMDRLVVEGGLDIDALDEIVGEEQRKLLQKRRRGLVKKGGSEPRLIQGYDSIPEMTRAMIGLAKKSDAVKNLAEQKLAAERETLSRLVQDDNVLPGDEDYHNDDRLAVLIAEAKLLNQKQTGKALAEKMKDARLEVAAVREAARQALLGMRSVDALDIAKFARQERKAAKEALSAKLAGDEATAGIWKQREMLNHALFMEAMDARIEMEKTEKRIKKAIGSKAMRPADRRLIERLAIQFGLHRPTKQKTTSAEWTDYKARMLGQELEIPTVEAWAKHAEELGYEVAFDPFILSTSEPISYRDLTWGQLRAVNEAVNIIRAIDRNERYITVNGERIALAELIDRLEAGLAPELKKGKKPPKPGSPYIDKKKHTLAGLHYDHAKIETILMCLDGFKRGAWWDAIFRPVAAAEDSHSVMLKQLRDDVKAAFAQYAKNKRSLFHKRILIPQINRSLTRAELLTMALNIGNEGNLNRLAFGEGWTKLDQNGNAVPDMDKIMSILDPLTKEDWDFVQKVWGLVDSFRPQAFALEEKMTGKRPERVQPVPVNTRFGQYAGGYYPIIYDADRSYKTYRRAQKEGDKIALGRNYGTSQTKHGHLKKRMEGSGGQKISFDLMGLTDHLFDVTKDLAYRENLMNVAKILRQDRVIKMIEDALGKEAYRQFEPWLQDIANETTKTPFSKFDRLARWARKGTTMMQMGLKATTMIQQPLGYLQTIAALGPKYAATGLGVYRNLPASHKLITEKSAFMANRIAGFDRDVRDSLKGLDAFNDLKHQAEKFAYYGIGMMQMGVDLPTWWGAYKKALAEGEGEKRAVAIADSVVRETQGSGSVKDLARVQRGPETAKLFTMFYSYFNVLYNMTYSELARTKVDKNIPRAAATAMLIWFLPAILSELISGRGPDDEDEWVPWMTKKLALYPFQMVVGLRDIANGVGSGFGYQMSPAASAPVSIVKWVNSLYDYYNDEKELEDLVKPTVDALGFISHLPLKQMEITVGNIWDYISGEDPEFKLRDLVFTKEKERR